jgi:hypothetical protein
MAHEFPIAALSSTFSRWLMLQVMMARTPVSRSTARISTSTSRPPMAAKPSPARTRCARQLRPVGTPARWFRGRLVAAELGRACRPVIDRRPCGGPP